MDCIYVALLSKVFLQLPDIHPFIHRRRCQPCKVTTNTSGAGGVLLRDTSTARRGPGIEPATFLSLDNPSYLLSYCRPGPLGDTGKGRDLKALDTGLAMFVVLPVIRASAEIQEKVAMSKSILWRLAENSTIPSSHSPNPRRHCSRCHTEPSQNTSFPSSGLDLRDKGDSRRGPLSKPLLIVLSIV